MTIYYLNRLISALSTGYYITFSGFCSNDPGISRGYLFVGVAIFSFEAGKHMLSLSLAGGSRDVGFEAREAQWFSTSNMRHHSN